MPKIVDHGQRRREIVYALWAVIYKRGIDGVTYRAVADEAGVSIGRIQHYFTSKHDLVLEGARTMIEMARGGWAAGPDDPRASLAALVRQPIPRSEQFRLGTAVWYAYVAAATADSDLEAIIREAVRDGIGAAAKLVASLPGHAAEGSAHTTAVRVVALGNGLAQAVLVGAVTADQALGVLDDELAKLDRDD